ncbi:MAG TPA: universal stress protein [Iamia sp.]|nr:universal stress protein [Iamia sp.]
MSGATGPRPAVVVGVDGSDPSRRAARWAAVEAAARGTTLRLVSAWQAPVLTTWATLATPGVDPTVFERSARETLDEVVRELRAAFGDGAPELAAETVEGLPRDVLLGAARGEALLVVGTRGRGGLARAVLGSVSAACAHHTPVPLAVIGEGAPDPGSGDLVVGFDGSPGAEAALRWAVVDARATGAAVRVVHGWAARVGEPDGIPPDGTVVGDLTAAVERAVADALAGLDALPRITVQVVPRAAAPALVAGAEGAGALVVGTRGHGGFVGLLLGSVSQACLHHAPGPVVIVPPAQ